MKVRKAAILFLVLALTFGLFTGCGKKEMASKLKVSVTIYPFDDAVKAISGGLVDVLVIVPPEVHLTRIRLRREMLKTFKAFR
jgi:ABC-type Zn uptake system ZnuABC Zn-binding protein ZnuA